MSLSLPPSACGVKNHLHGCVYDNIMTLISLAINHFIRRQYIASIAMFRYDNPGIGSSFLPQAYFYGLRDGCSVSSFPAIEVFLTSVSRPHLAAALDVLLSCDVCRWLC